MKYFLISYDLHSLGMTEQNYSDLYDEIKSLGVEWKHPMESTWIVLTGDDITPVQIRERLKKHIKNNDLLFIVNVTTQEYAGWLASSFWDWFRKK